MGLFSFGRKKLEDGFEFVIDGIYALKGNSAVAAGKLTRGRLIPGTEAICLNELGEPVFKCRISGIEQGTKILRAASYDMKGTYGPHYGFKLDGAVKEDVPKGAVLVPVTDELLEVVSETEEPAFKATPAPKVIDFNRISGLTMEDLQGVPEENENDLEAVKKAGERDENLAALLPKKREDELSALVAGEGTLSEALLVPLSVKECIFMICRLQQMNEQSEMPDYNEKGQLLYDAVVEKLKMSSSLYILLDKGTGLPYIIVATAPSMDGYVADGAPIFSQGYKYSPVAHLTYGLVGDTDILKTAPQDLIQAGYGDVVGKITAIADWDLAVKANNDYRCDTCVTLVNRALDKCFAKAEGLKDRDPESLGALLEALTLTGVAMALVNISRPASGAEHMLSHFWEMDYIARGLNPNHHGIQVGVATPIIARFFEELADILPEGTGALCPPHEEIEALLAKGGAPTSPKDIGISKELFHDSLLKGYTVRPRYSIMQFAKDNGRLEEIADKITEEIYG